jgi:hypothetical protein
MTRREGAATSTTVLVNLTLRGRRHGELINPNKVSTIAATQGPGGLVKQSMIKTVRTGPASRWTSTYCGSSVDSWC